MHRRRTAAVRLAAVERGLVVELSTVELTAVVECGGDQVPSASIKLDSQTAFRP